MGLSPKPFSALWLSVVPACSQRAYLQRRLLAHAIGNSLFWNGLSLYAMAWRTDSTGDRPAGSGRDALESCCITCCGGVTRGASVHSRTQKFTLPTHPRHAKMLTVRVWMVHALCVQRRHDCTVSLLDDCVCVCNAVIDPGGPPLARNAANPARLRGFGVE